jgi:hypothetical protein
MVPEADWGGLVRRSTVPSDRRRYAPATARNRDPILEVLRRVLPGTGTVLEIASGTGEHSLYFAEHFPKLIWQPSDPDPQARGSIDAWVSQSTRPNIRHALDIDVCQGDWGIEAASAVVCINMLHISPWECCKGLMRGAARILSSDAILYLYGPYKVDGADTAPSNQAFDESLRQQNPEWGVRDLQAVVAVAESHGFAFEEVIAMPANNLSVVLRRPYGRRSLRSPGDRSERLLGPRQARHRDR